MLPITKYEFKMASIIWFGALILFIGLFSLTLIKMNSGTISLFEYYIVAAAVFGFFVVNLKVYKFLFTLHYRLLIFKICLWRQERHFKTITKINKDIHILFDARLQWDKSVIDNSDALLEEARKDLIKNKNFKFFQD